MIAEHLLRQSVVTMESTIPPHMTIEQWRRLRSPGAQPKRRYSVSLLAAARRVVSLRPAPCDHLHESTTRYDQEQKVLTFLLVCPVGGTEKVMKTQHLSPASNRPGQPGSQTHPAGPPSISCPSGDTSGPCAAPHRQRPPVDAVRRDARLVLPGWVRSYTR